MIRKGCVALSMQLYTGLDDLLDMTPEDLNEYAAIVKQIAEEVARRGKKQNL